MLHGKKNPVCPECFAQEGRWHHWNCKVETCPICGGRLAECEHGPNGKINTRGVLPLAFVLLTIPIYYRFDDLIINECLRHDFGQILVYSLAD